MGFDWSAKRRRPVHANVLQPATFLGSSSSARCNAARAVAASSLRRALAAVWISAVTAVTPRHLGRHRVVAVGWVERRACSYSCIAGSNCSFSKHLAGLEIKLCRAAAIPAAHAGGWAHRFATVCWLDGTLRACRRGRVGLRSARRMAAAAPLLRGNRGHSRNAVSEPLSGMRLPLTLQARVAASRSASEVAQTSGRCSSKRIKAEVACGDRNHREIVGARGLNVARRVAHHADLCRLRRPVRAPCGRHGRSALRGQGTGR